VNSVMASEPVVKQVAHTTIRKHRSGAWKALVVSARGEQSVPLNYPATQGGAEWAAMVYAGKFGWEYRKPVQP
jgi:hypothetical protein